MHTLNRASDIAKTREDVGTGRVPLHGLSCGAGATLFAGHAGSWERHPLWLRWQLMFETSLNAPISLNTFEIEQCPPHVVLCIPCMIIPWSKLG